MLIRNTNTRHDNVRVVDLGMQLVRYDEVIEVDPVIAALLLIQPDNWSPADEEAEALAVVAIAAQAEALAAAAVSPILAQDAAADEAIPGAPESEPDAAPKSDDTSPPADDDANTKHTRTRKGAQA